MRACIMHHAKWWTRDAALWCEALQCIPKFITVLSLPLVLANCDLMGHLSKLHWNSRNNSVSADELIFRSLWFCASLFFVKMEFKFRQNIPESHRKTNVRLANVASDVPSAMIQSILSQFGTLVSFHRFILDRTQIWAAYRNFRWVLGVCLEIVVILNVFTGFRFKRGFRCHGGNQHEEWLRMGNIADSDLGGWRPRGWWGEWVSLRLRFAG